MSLRIATFNVENLDETSSSPTLAERIVILRPQLRRLRADIICFQEVHGQERAGQPRQLLALQELLKETDYENFHIEHTKTANNQAYDKRNLVVVSRFPITNTQQIKFDLIEAPRYQHVTAIPPDDDADPVRLERPIFHVTISVNQNFSLHVINLHLKSRLASNIQGQKVNRFAWRSASGWAEGFFVSSMKRVAQALETRVLIDTIFDQDAAANIVVCGDYNAHPEEVPVETIAGRVENTGNSNLTGRVLTPCENSIPDSVRYTFIHQGDRRLLDHMLISRNMLNVYVRSEIHNETLHDESISFAFDTKFPESDHAPFIAEFDV